MEPRVVTGRQVGDHRREADAVAQTSRLALPKHSQRHSLRAHDEQTFEMEDEWLLGPCPMTAMPECSASAAASQQNTGANAHIACQASKSVLR
jgi:hypothetical protein